MYSAFESRMVINFIKDNWIRWGRAWAACLGDDNLEYLE
jgi:hypothetical protein